MELRPWIERRLAEAAEARAQSRPATGRCRTSATTLELRPRRAAPASTAAATSCSCPTATRPAIERWYRRMAREEIAPRLDEAVEALGVRYAAVTIRNQRTRWGSCSTTGAMSFNWRLLLAPEEVLDYVVWHEACHLVVMDHSRRFWSLVERHGPGYRAPRRWLRDNGATLVL